MGRISKGVGRCRFAKLQIPFTFKVLHIWTASALYSLLGEALQNRHTYEEQRLAGNEPYALIVSSSCIFDQKRIGNEKKEHNT